MLIVEISVKLLKNVLLSLIINSLDTFLIQGK